MVGLIDFVCPHVDEAPTTTTTPHPHTHSHSQQCVRYVIVVFRISPWLFGHAKRRPRKYTVMLLREKFEWLGSPDEFEGLFARQVVMDASEFFCAGQEELESIWKESAGTKMKLRRDGSAPDPMSLVSPAQRRRSQEYIANAKYGPNLYADIQQEMEFCSAGPYIPPLLRGSLLFSSKLGRCAIGREHLVMQGIAAFDF